MKFLDISNIWTVELSELSNADRAKVFFERAKQVVHVALRDAAERALAIKGTRFHRAYLVERIGACPSVTTQNPKIRDLLVLVDQQLEREAVEAATARSEAPIGKQSVIELKRTIAMLRKLLDSQDRQISDLRKRLDRRD